MSNGKKIGEVAGRMPIPWPRSGDLAEQIGRLGDIALRAKVEAQQHPSVHIGRLLPKLMWPIRTVHAVPIPAFALKTRSRNGLTRR